MNVGVIVCRSAPPKESLTPGARLGYECSICEEPLQITPGGLEALASAKGARLLCNECGLVYVHLAEGLGEPVISVNSPAAKAQLDQGNNSQLAKWVRKHTV